MDKEHRDDFAGNGDGRANEELLTTRRLRARTSSCKRGTSQAIDALSPKLAVPAKPCSRRKAGAETIPTLSPKLPLSPRSSQPAGHGAVVTHEPHAGGPIESGGERQPEDATHCIIALAAAIDEIREQWKCRQMWHRTEKSLTLQAKAMCRRLMQGDKKEAEVLYKSTLNGGEHEMAIHAFPAMYPLLEARKVIEAARLTVEKRLLVLAKDLPVAPWVDTIRGFGVLSLAGIVGEAGDLSNYSNFYKLNKRMGVAVIKGERQRKKEGAAGIEHGYNPPRRSLMWTVGDCIIRAGGPLKELYNERKVFELEKTQKIAADPVERKKYTGESGKYAPVAHAHNRAKRYMEKRLLRDLWRAWRDASSSLSPIFAMHPSDSSMRGR